ncbi:hypothetical protein [Methylophaga sp.]|uniref:hypothetical protein n=1 Tax=Methylophaga sp. TaxID=2024840 RepID=UPI003A93B7DE
MMMNLKRPRQDCTQPDYLLRRLRRNHIAWGYLSPRLWLEAATLAGRSTHETGSQAACEMMVNDDITCYALIDYRSA